MTFLARNLALALASALVPAVVHADSPAIGPVDERNVVAGKTALDPSVGYVFASGTGRQAATLLRVPDGATGEAYQKDWEKAFAKAEKRYKSDYASWQSAVNTMAKTGTKPPPEPEAPVREKFTIDAMELRDQTGFGPMNVYRKGATAFSYLTRLKPGTYIYYGPITVVPGVPVIGNCYCMGTVKFEVKPGMITDLGNFLTAAPKAEPPFDVMTMTALKQAQAKAAKKGGATTDLVAAPVAFGLPESLKSWPSVRAEFSASGKLNNYFGIFVSRMPPIPGILAYRRDTVVDARTNTDVPNPSIFTQVRIKK